MDIAAYKASLTKSLSKRTSCFLMSEEKVLLGLKKKGFGKGYFVGIGGKLEKSETIENAMKREVQEEIGVEINTFTKVATIYYYFPYVTDESWNMQVTMFSAFAWNDEPKETEEIRPEWFAKKNLPLEKMWDDAKIYMPKLLAGETFRAEIFYDKTNQHVFKFSIKEKKIATSLHLPRAPAASQ